MTVDEIKAELSEVKVALSRVEAILGQMSDRQRDEIDTIFSQQRAHEARLAAVEANYVRRAENDTDHREFRTSIVEQRVGLARMLVISAILAALGSAVLTAAASIAFQKAFGAPTAQGVKQ